ncbi:MAG: hypothetical protein DRO88_04045 [Promethearchaeia archaeon]|nr:MAG: hypothetical protein DRO88_04045 [Candidatus Lokiarchaeia archaeon]
MRATVDDYGYVFIKLAVLKSLLMSPQDRKKILSFRDLESLGNYIKHFFPLFRPEGLTISQFERNLWKTYIDIEEKILVSAPFSIQSFLRTLMVRYEIWNIKIAIHGVIEGLSIEEKKEHIYEKPPVILEREEFMLNLLKAKNFTEIRTACECTPYKAIINRGLDHIEKSGEIFHLEQDLDKFYFTNILEHSSYFKKDERDFIDQFVRSQIDFYNFNLLYRAYFNGIAKEEITDYLLFQGSLLNAKSINLLLSANNFDDFLKKLSLVLKKHLKLYNFIPFLKNPNPQVWQNLSAVFLDIFLSRFQRSIMAEIPLKSIALIFQIILYKETEIKEIIARAVQIALIQEKY